MSPLGHLLKAADRDRPEDTQPPPGVSWRVDDFTVDWWMPAPPETANEASSGALSGPGDDTEAPVPWFAI